MFDAHFKLVVLEVMDFVVMILHSTVHVLGFIFIWLWEGRNPGGK